MTHDIDLDDPTLEERLEAQTDDPAPGLISGELLLAFFRRIRILWQNGMRIEVVPTVADLPAEAGARQWFRVANGTLAERASIYVGNGEGRPLTKITPTQL